MIPLVDVKAQYAPLIPELQEAFARTLDSLQQRGLALPAAATHALQLGVPISDGEYDIVTYYYDTAVQDAASGNGFIRLRVNAD